MLKETVKLEKNDLEKLRDLISEEWFQDRKNFLGKVLTIIDACIQDKDQRKSIKDLIQNEYYGNIILRHRRAVLTLLRFAEKHCKEMTPKEESYHDFIGIDPRESIDLLEVNPFNK